MCFNIWRRPLILVGWIALSACGLRIGEKAPPEKPVVIGGSGFSCLSKISEHLQSYFDAQMRPNQIRQFMGCIRYSFDSFSKHARGLERNVFTPEEIRDFLHEYFLKDKTISDELLKDFMVIKKTLVGGSLTHVTRSDLAQANAFLLFAEEQMIKMHPYMHIYNFSLGRTWALQNKQVIEPEIEVAVRVLQEVSEGFGLRLGQANSPYPLSHLESFMREFREFSGWEDIFTNSRSPAAWVAFVSAYKSMTAGSEGEFVQPKDWPSLFRSAASIYGLTLKARYAGQRESLMYGEGLAGVTRIAADVVRLSRSAVEQQPKKLISYAQFDRLIDALEPLGLMPRVPSADESSGRAVKPESVKKILRALFDRVLGDMNIPWRLRVNEGLNLYVIDQAQDEFGRWAEIQQFLDRTFRTSDKENLSGRVETLSERLGPIGASQDFMRLLGDGQNKNSALSLVRMMEQSLRPLFRPGEDQVFLTESSLLAKYQLVHGFHNLSMMNLSRAVVGLVGRGYSTFRGQAGLLDGGITDEEMQAFYMDFRDFGVDMQLFDPRSDNAGYRSYQEANLFTYTGNGLQRLNRVENPRDAMMSYPEGMEYLLFILSGGAMGRALYTGMMGANGLCEGVSQDAPISVHGYRMVERRCFREKLMQVLLPRLNTMPTMRSELERAPVNEKLNMADNLMATIFSPKFSDPDYIEWHEINTIAVIMHFTESVMTRYNANQDIYLDTAEVWKAYETFRVYMENLAESRCNRYIEGVRFPMSESGQAETRLGRIIDWTALQVKEEREWFRSLYKTGLCSHIPEFVSKAVFAHIVKFGEVPQSLRQVNFTPALPLVGIEFKVDRAGLLKVFAALVKANSESSAKAAARK